MIASWGLGLLALRQGNLHRALPLLERAVGICQDADLPALFPQMAATLGVAYTLCGRVADAVPLLRHAMEQTIATERVVYQTLCRLSLGGAHLRLANWRRHIIEHALALARERQERGHQVYALRLLGEIAAQRNPPESAQAEAHYRQALALADELGMRPLQAHCHRGLGTLYAATGQREPARTALSAAMALYQAMAMTFWLPEAEAARHRWRGGDHVCTRSDRAWLQSNAPRGGPARGVRPSRRREASLPGFGWSHEFRPPLVSENQS